MDREHEAAGVIDERVVDSPGVDADGGEFRALRERGDGGAEAGLHLVPERADLPVVVAAEGAEGVGEAVHFLERELVLGPRAEDDAAAGGAEVDGGGENGRGHDGDCHTRIAQRAKRPAADRRCFAACAGGAWGNGCSFRAPEIHRFLTGAGIFSCGGVGRTARFPFSKC